MEIKEIRKIISAEEIAARVQVLAKEIDAVYGDEPLVLVGVLKGAGIFLADLVRALKNPHVEMDFVRVCSYGYTEHSSREVTITKDAELPLGGKHVLIVEDIVDTGHSLHFLYEIFKKRNVLSLRTVVFLDKKERREVKVAPDFVAFSIDNGFVVGYGLDYAEKYRGLPDLCVINPEEHTS